MHGERISNSFNNSNTANGSQISASLRIQNTGNGEVAQTEVLYALIPNVENPEQVYILAATTTGSIAAGSFFDDSFSVNVDQLEEAVPPGSYRLFIDGRVLSKSLIHH